MTDRPKRARRVQLSTPGSSEKMMQKASESKADHVFLDLEDAVAPSQKRDARKKIVQALKTLNWTGKTRCVRINDLTTEYAYEDIIENVEGAGEHLDTFMMTKVQTAVEAYRSLPASRNPGASPPASLAVLKFSGLLDAKTGDYVTYTRVRSNGHWVPHYANGPKGNCV